MTFKTNVYNENTVEQGSKASGGFKGEGGWGSRSPPPIGSKFVSKKPPFSV